VGGLNSLTGDLVGPGEPGFDDARSLWNIRFDRRPELVVRCSNSGDVKAGVDHARQSGMTLSVKGGGHSYAANSVANSGVLVDLSHMKRVTVDPEQRTAVVEGGVTCAELDAATQVYGLATPTPTVSSVGVIGAALGGGGGYLTRRFGLTLDNVLSAEVVTADGRLLRVSPDENPDLFWAIRGGGGNFGVVTSMELRLHEVGPQVLAGQVIYPFDNAREYLRFFREFMGAAPNEFQCYPFCFRIPPIELFPEETHGQPVLDFVICHQDPDASGFVEPLQNLGPAILSLVGPTSYVDAQTSFDANLPKGQRYTSKAHDLAALSDGAIDTMVEYVPRMVGGLTAAYFDPLGGAVGEVEPSATPYGGRDTLYGFHIIAGWMDQSEDESVLGWADEFSAAMASHATGGVYVNLIADDETHRIPSAYGDNYTRLVELKQKWDPDNLFANNYNIPPV
jgi:hypothetical protein